MTNTADLLALNQHYLEIDQAAAQILSHDISAGTQLIAPVRIDANVTIGQGCVIGPSVYIEQGCQIGANVHIANAIILRHTSITPDQQIVNQVV